MNDGFDLAIRGLLERDGFEVDDEGGHVALRKLGMSAIAAACGAPGLMTYMGPTLDLGVSFFAVYVEKKHFRAGTARNALLHHYVLRWRGTPWSLISFPGESLSAEEIEACMGECEVVGSASLHALSAEDEALAAGVRPASDLRLFAGGWVAPDFVEGRTQYIMSCADSWQFRNPGGAIKWMEAKLASLE